MPLKVKVNFYTHLRDDDGAYPHRTHCAFSSAGHNAIRRQSQSTARLAGPAHRSLAHANAIDDNFSEADKVAGYGGCVELATQAV